MSSSRRFWIIGLVSLAGLACAGCYSEAAWMHAHMHSWAIEICDGHGGRLHPLRWKTYYELLAEALLYSDSGVRSAAIMDATTTGTWPCWKYFYLPDAYIDNGQDGLLEKYLRLGRERSQPDGKERLDIVHAIVQLQMRRYLWAHPDFGLACDLKPNPPPQRGFGMFWKDQYPVFAQRLLSEKDGQFALDWEEYRRLNRLHYGWDPAFPKKPGTRPSAPDL